MRAILDLPVAMAWVLLGSILLLSIPYCRSWELSDPFPGAHRVSLGSYDGRTSLERVSSSAEIEECLNALLQVVKLLPTYYLDSYNDLGAHLHYLHADERESFYESLPPGPQKDLWLLARAIRLRCRVPPTYVSALDSRELRIREASTPEVRALLELYAKTELAQIDFGQAPPGARALGAMRFSPLELPRILELDPSNLVTWTALALELEGHRGDLGYVGDSTGSADPSELLLNRLHLHCTLLRAELAASGLRKGDSADAARELRELTSPRPQPLEALRKRLQSPALRDFHFDSAADIDQRALAELATVALDSLSDLAQPKAALEDKFAQLKAQLRLVLLNNLMDVWLQLLQPDRSEQLQLDLLRHAHEVLDEICEQGLEHRGEKQDWSLPPLHVFRLTLLEYGVALRANLASRSSSGAALDTSASRSEAATRLRTLIRQNRGSRSFNPDLRYGRPSSDLVYRLIKGGNSPLRQIASASQVVRMAKTLGDLDE